MSSWSKGTFNILFNLQKNQPWVASQVEELEVLLFKECITDDHRELIIDLISDFKYLTNDKFILLLSELTEDIVTDPYLSDCSTQIVAMAADSRADSSQHILYTLKPMLEKMGWRKYKQVNRFGAAFKTYKRSKTHKNIVLVDEFVGTGETLVGRATTLNRVFSSKGVKDFTIKAKVLVATEMGLERVRSEGIDISSRITLNKGITDRYTSSLVKGMIKLMIDLEDNLLPSYDGKDLPSLGYGGTESLYCREDGNTPNSVFPIFWWPFYDGGESRRPLLTRAMGDA